MLSAAALKLEKNTVRWRGKKAEQANVNINFNSKFRNMKVEVDTFTTGQADIYSVTLLE